MTRITHLFDDVHTTYFWGARAASAPRRWPLSTPWPWPGLGRPTTLAATNGDHGELAALLGVADTDRPLDANAASEVPMPAQRPPRRAARPLTVQVEALVHSQNWKDFLAVAARLHRYSANNVLLIRSQMPTATRVAGYRRWHSLGRQVRQGEAGLAILAPCVSSARPLDEPEADERPELARILRGFRVAHVFDPLSQTNGDGLADVRPALLAGEAPEGLWGRPTST